MTPTRKGLYDECITCVHKLPDNTMKYPCIFSHKKVRIASGVVYERDMKSCKLYEGK